MVMINDMDSLGRFSKRKIWRWWLAGFVSTEEECSLEYSQSSVLKRRSVVTTAPAACVPDVLVGEKSQHRRLELHEIQHCLTGEVFLYVETMRSRYRNVTKPCFGVWRPRDTCGMPLGLI